MGIQRWLGSCLMVIIFCGVAFAQSHMPFVAEVLTDDLNVRAGQHTNFESLGQLEKGSQVVAVEETYNWFKIRLPKNMKAYVSNDYIKQFDNGIGQVTGSRVNVRAGAGTHFTALGQLEEGQLIKIIKIEGKWLLIEPVPRLYGWVHGDYIGFKSTKVDEEKYPDYKTPVMEVIDKKVSLVKVKEPEVKPEPPKPKFKVDEVIVDIGAIEALSSPVCEEQYTHKFITQNNVRFYLFGPTSILDSFGSAKVKIKGKVRKVEDKVCPLPTLSVSTVNLVL